MTTGAGLGEPNATSGARARIRRAGADRAAAVALELAPLALVTIAEASWISVVGGLLQEFALQPAVVGVPALAAFVVAGVVAAHWLGPRLGPRWPAVALGLIVAAAAAGWALSGEARDAVATGPLQALAAHPGGLVAGLALLRGFAHANMPLAEDTVSHLLARGVPGLAIASLLGSLIGEPLRTRFLGETLGSAIVFIAAAALALALTRLDDIGRDGGFNWRRNPKWFLLTVAILATAILVAVPLAALAGTLVSLVISVALGPLLILGLATGLDRTARRVLIFFAIVCAVIFILPRSVQPPTGAVATSGAAFGDQPSSTAEKIMTAGLGGLLLLAAIVTVIVLVALWMRRTTPPDEDLHETRTIDVGGDPVELPRRAGRFRRRATPGTAVEAYVALVDELDRRPDARREVGETPAAHAARMRASGRSGLGLDLLAADYGLARFGDVTLSEREDARGVERWRRLRRSLVRSRPGTGATAGDASVPIAGSEAPEGTRTGLRAG